MFHLLFADVTKPLNKLLRKEKKVLMVTAVPSNLQLSQTGFIQGTHPPVP